MGMAEIRWHMVAFLLVLCMELNLCEDKILVTQARTEYLKKHASYEVVDYESNVFKGWTEEEAKTLLLDPQSYPTAEALPLFTETKKKPEEALDWRKRKPDCIAQVHSQGGCSSSWAYTTAHMLGERVYLN